MLGLSTTASVFAGVWSAIVTMSLAVFTGVLLELYLAPIPLESMRAWAEFQRSGRNDLAAFAIAETLDSATSHLLIAPFVASIFALLGICTAGIADRFAATRKR